jgi:soluble lytic murein transglycosylase-like protein
LLSLRNTAADAIAYLGGISVDDLTRMSETAITRYAPQFQQVGKELNIPPALLAAIAWTESAFIATAKNPSSGATGLMQLMPFNFAPYGIAHNPTDPLGNIRAGARDLLAKGYGKKSLRDALKGYNGFRSEGDPVKLAAFTLYYRRITSRWCFITVNQYV